MGLFENRRQSNDGQHGKDKGLQETNDQAEADPKIRDDERDQLIQDGKQDFTGKDVAKNDAGPWSVALRALPKD